MSTVVFGATGQLGRRTVTSLLSQGTSPDRILAVGRNTDVLASLARFGVRTRRVDMDVAAEVTAAVQDSSTVVLISGTEPQRLEQHRRVIDAAATDSAS